MKAYLLLMFLCCCISSFGQYKVLECSSGDCENGRGVARLDNFRDYKGEFKNGKPDGKGIIVNASYYGETPEYVGEFKNGFMHGKGTVLYKKNMEYAEGTYANGVLVNGTIYFETGKKAVITSVKEIKTGYLYTGKLLGGDKEIAFADKTFESIQETAYNEGSIARNPKLMEELSADIKAMTAMFKEKFEKVDQLLALYAGLLNCPPDDMPCIQVSATSIQNQYSLFTQGEAIELDTRVDRIQKNLLDYRTRPTTTAQDKKDAALIVQMIDRLKSRDLSGPQNAVTDGLQKVSSAMQNAYGKGNISVMKANWPFQKIAIKEQREKDWDAWTLLTQKF